MYCLNDIAPGERARVVSQSTCGALRRRLLDMGLIAGTEVECVGKSPAGDPRAYLIRGAVIAGVLLAALQRSGALHSMQTSLS